MTNITNLRALRITVDGMETREQALQWLSKQDEAIQRVTRVNKDGFLEQSPVVGAESYVDPTSQLIGGVILGRGCYVGPFAVVRLDEKPTPEPLIIGDETNLQDGSIVHSTTQKIGARVIVAHQSIVHGAQIEDDVTIYIQAVADGGGTVIQSGTFLHQGSYVGKGINIPKGSYVEPGRKILTQAEADALPPVPQALIDIRNHVLEHNREHTVLHSNRLP
ncbi:MAG: hypothetical protein GY847_27105 [Proteobacteria bacterium]|nr:hypothetical protein [Pseudomonadota bacterium]